ncbi:hypothetical protein MBLNU230_g2675t1 [Neophaeotheca triangularis]
MSISYLEPGQNTTLEFRTAFTTENDRPSATNDVHSLVLMHERDERTLSEPGSLMRSDLHRNTSALLQPNQFDPLPEKQPQSGRSNEAPEVWDASDQLMAFGNSVSSQWTEHPAERTVQIFQQLDLGQASGSSFFEGTGPATLVEVASAQGPEPVRERTTSDNRVDLYKAIDESERLTNNAAYLSTCFCDETYRKCGRNLERIESLLNQGVDVNMQDTRYRMTALHWMFRDHIFGDSNCPVRAIQLFLDRGADVNHVDVYKSTPLHDALKARSCRECIYTLLSAGADVHKRDDEGTTPLILYAKTPRYFEHDQDVIQMLVGSGDSIDVREQSGMSALHTAVSLEKDDLVRSLLKHGANVTLLTHQSKSTVLHFAATSDWIDMLKLLLDTKAAGLINELDTNGHSALFYAATSYHEDGAERYVQLLLEAGAQYQEPEVGPLFTSWISASADAMAMLLSTHAGTGELLCHSALTSCVSEMLEWEFEELMLDGTSLDVILQVAASRQPSQLLVALGHTIQWMDERKEEVEKKEEDRAERGWGPSYDAGCWYTMWEFISPLLTAYKRTLEQHRFHIPNAIIDELRASGYDYTHVPWHQRLAKVYQKLGKQKTLEEIEETKRREEDKSAELERMQEVQEV